MRILKNENFSAIYEKIFADIETPIFFYAYLKRVEKFPEKVKFGYYRADNITIREFLNNIEAGKESAFRFTIPEGFTIYDIAKKIKETKLLDSEVFLKKVRDPVFIKGLTGMDIISLEGFLYPDTYFLTPEINEEEFIKKMYSNFLTKIPENFASVVAQKGLTFYQGIILASIIQKETFVKEEYPVIASVFFNRLQRAIRLQSDPTTIYGLGDRFDGNLKKRDLLDRANPYNTYAISGLPPTPICNPSIEAIKGVMYPANTQYLYFVATRDGKHIFARTYEEHLLNVKKYQKNN